MKKYIGIITVLFTLSFVLIACSNSNDSAGEEKNNDNLSEESNNEGSNDDNSNESSENLNDSFIDHDDFEDPMQLRFSSGAGAWSTVIHLARDGSFSGIYLDSNAGMSGDGYLSTNYISVFTGMFDEIEKLDENTYSMKLLDISYEHEDGEEWIEDQAKHIATEAYGFEEGKNFFLYSPQKSTQDLNEDFLSWGRISKNDSNSKEELLHWALHNEKTDYGFYSEQYLDDPEIESEETFSNDTNSLPANTLPTSFDHIAFDNNYSGPGSEFIGTWHEINNTTVGYAPNPWKINYKEGTFYINAELSGDPRIIIMTAEYKDGKLYSDNGTYIALLDYENPETLEIELPETVEIGGETSQFFFENGYLQWSSESDGDLRDLAGPNGGFEGYEKR